MTPKTSPATGARTLSSSPFPRYRFPLLLLLLAAVLTACAGVSNKAPYPHESLLTIVAELKIFLNQDPYRQAPGQDLNGRNIYRVSLERLDALGTMSVAGMYRDAIAFARGECLERLGDWTAARRAFADAAAVATPLAQTAALRATFAEKMAKLTDRRTFAPTLDGYLNDLDVQERSVREWLAAKPAWPYDSYLRQTLEAIQDERTRLLFTNRQVLPAAVSKALAAGQKQVDDHPQSWRASDHALLLGAMYETLARDWTSQNRPEGPAPRLDEGWSGWIERAREAYRKVAQADGDPAKLEGQARLRALDAYALRMQSLAR